MNLFQVISTHPYSGEDDDELTFEGGEVIYCVEYDDPDEQVIYCYFTQD